MNAIGGPVAGDFSMQVAFANAQLPGPGLDQAQFDAFFQDGSVWFDVRDTLATGQSHQNVHVWTGAVPDQGVTNTTATAGTFSIVRSGSTLSGYFNGVLIYSAAATSAPLDSIALELNNNLSQDATAVTFLNFSITAASVSFPFPTITNVENAASGIQPGLPNAAIAQGSIFVVYGSDLGPSNISFAASAFQNTTLSDTSVAVTVGGVTVNALLYYASAAQVAALLPSNTPAGTGTVTVTYNSQTSVPAPITVAANNLGIFTIDSSGRGPGIVTYTDYSLVSAVKATPCGGPNTVCGAANPGDTLLLWGTGLGPVSGSDASGAGLGENMPNIPLKLWLGGVQAPVVYQGRSGCCIGEDQIVFTVPDNVPAGCAVPLLVQIGSEISNNTVMPVANGSRNCTPNNPALGSINIAQAFAGPFSSGSITLGKYFNSSGNSYQDEAQLEFKKNINVNPGDQPFFASWLDDQPLGVCLVNNSLSGTNNPHGTFVPPTTGSSVAANAGPSFTVQGPNGSIPVTGTPGSFSATLSAAGTFLIPGAYTVTGTGGADVGAFTATTTLPGTPSLVSPASGDNLTVVRSTGMTVTWKGGGGNVQISLTGATDSTFAKGAQAFCTVPASAGTFAIPPYVLLALPNPTGNFTTFQFSPVTEAVPFTAAGLTLGTLGTYNDGTRFGGFTLQ